MGFHDHTEMGGTRGAFLTTHWTLIEDVKAGSDKKKELIGLIESLTEDNYDLKKAYGKKSLS